VGDAGCPDNTHHEAAVEERRRLGRGAGSAQPLDRGLLPCCRGPVTGLNDLVESYPPEMRELFGIGEGTDLTKIEDFLAAQTFNFLAPLALAFFPILASAGPSRGRRSAAR
jgi:hypothetical protein